MQGAKRQMVSSQANEGAVALKAFFRIAERWKLTQEQERVLLAVAPATLYRWKKQKEIELHRDTLERISYVLGIYKALHILLPSTEAADSWLHKPNMAPLFGGRSALDKLMCGRVVDLSDVRRYLDAQRGW